jgi:hypothetical protein
MIRTWSKFNYGFQIDTSNNSLNFSEGGPELTAVLESGDYTLGEFAEVVATALSAIGALDYTASINRNTNVITLSASGTFSILLATGSNIGISFASLMGFSQVVDLTGAATYTGASAAGFQYYPQFLLQSYVPPEIFKQSADATVNKAASGRVEVIRFGVEQFIEMDIKFITDLPMDNVVIKNNSSGLQDAIDFLDDITQKAKFEFVPDVDTPATFYEVILESFPGFQNGAGFKLKELFAQNLPDFYETGVIKLRVVF